MRFGKKITFALFASSIMYGAITPSMSFAEIIDVAPVTVTATRSEKVLLDVPMSVSVVTADEISKMAAVDLANILNGIPGVRVTQNGNSDTITIRGESANETLVLIDGVKVSSDYGVGESGFQLPYIDPALIERVEVIKGPASVLYGAEALGGVINIILKKGGEKPFQGEISTSYSSLRDAFLTSATVYGRHDNFKYRVAGTYQNLSDRVEYHESIPDSDRQSGDGMVYLGYDFTDKISAGVTYEYGLKKYNYSDGDIRETKGITNRIATEFLVKDIAPFLPNLKATFSYFDSKSDSAEYKIAGKDEDGTTSIKNYNFALQSDWLISDHTSIIAGYEYLHESYDLTKEDALVSPDYWSGILDPYTEYRQGDADTHAAYIAVEHYLPYDFTLGYGVRYTHYSDSSDGQYRNYQSGKHTTLGTSNSGSEDDFVFNANLVWTGIDNLALRATFAQGFNPANFYNKYYNFDVGRINIGDPNMKSEKSNTYELGARYSDGKITMDLATFYSDTSNRFDTLNFTDPTSGTRYTYYMNVANSTSWGLEYSLSYKFDIGLEPYMSGTWQRRKDNISSATGGSGESTYVTDLPIFSTTLGLRYYDEVFENVFFNADLNMYYQTNVPVYEYVRFTPVVVSDADYATVNLSLGLEYGENKDFYTQLNLNNIFDNKYYNQSAEAQPGFNANIKVGYRF